MRFAAQAQATLRGDNMSKVQKRYLLIGGVLGLIVLALIFGAVRPPRKALGAQPSTSDVEVVQVEKKDVPIYAEWIGTLDGLVNADVRAQVTGYLLKQGYCKLRTDDEIMSEMVSILGFSRRGARIEAAIRSALQIYRAIANSDRLQ
jgi:hypothetical protein